MKTVSRIEFKLFKTNVLKNFVKFRLYYSRLFDSQTYKHNPQDTVAQTIQKNPHKYENGILYSSSLTYS